MVGRPLYKIYCMAKRKYDGKQCKCKGILQKTEGIYVGIMVDCQKDQQQ